MEVLDSVLAGSPIASNWKAWGFGAGLSADRGLEPTGPAVSRAISERNGLVSAQHFIR